jgi:hypothetical protein
MPGALPYFRQTDNLKESLVEFQLSKKWFNHYTPHLQRLIVKRQFSYKQTFHLPILGEAIVKAS